MTWQSSVRVQQQQIVVPVASATVQGLQVLAENPARRLLIIQNQSAGSLRVTFSGDATSSIGLLLIGNSNILLDEAVPTNPVSMIAVTAAVNVSIIEG